MGKSDNFFEKQTLQSRIKTEIVTKYFFAWSRVMAGYLSSVGRDKRIAYYDFFSGPGIYKNGTKSTPIIILEEAVKNDYLKNNLITRFVDDNPEHCRLLEKAKSLIPNITELHFVPEIYEISVSDRLVEELESFNRVPTLVFIDPWGYKGLSTRLINTVIKDWGCDCIFFFNYDSINRWLNNPNVNQHIGAIFGSNRLKILQALVENMEPHKREEKIMHELKQALYENDCKYVLQFCFKKDRGDRTSHYIVFVTKDWPHVRAFLLWSRRRT